MLSAQTLCIIHVDIYPVSMRESLQSNKKDSPDDKVLEWRPNSRILRPRPAYRSISVGVTYRLESIPRRWQAMLLFSSTCLSIVIPSFPIHNTVFPIEHTSTQTNRYRLEGPIYCDVHFWYIKGECVTLYRFQFHRLILFPPLSRTQSPLSCVPAFPLHSRRAIDRESFAARDHPRAIVRGNVRYSTCKRAAVASFYPYFCIFSPLF